MSVSTVFRKIQWDGALVLMAIIGASISTLHIRAFYYSHDTPKWFVFDLFACLYIFFVLNKKKGIELSCLGVVAVTLIMIMLWSFLWAPNLGASLEFTLRFVVSVLLGYCLILQFLKATHIDLLLGTVFFSALVFCIAFVVERYWLTLAFNVGTFSPIGFMNNAGQVFNIWIPCLVLFCYQVRTSKWLFSLGLMTLLCVVAILMEAATRGTIIGLTISELLVFLMSLKKNKKQAFVFLTITVCLTAGIGLYQVIDALQHGRLNQKIAVLQNSISDAGSGRLQLYKNTWSMLEDNPLGVGINNFEYIHPKYAQPGTIHSSPMVNENTILRTPHNIVLKLFSELGYIGGSLFVVFLGGIYYIALRGAIQGGYIDKWLFVAVSATMIHSMLSAVFLTPASLFFSTLLFAAVVSRSNYQSWFAFSIPGVRMWKWCILLLPVIATSALASEYYSYQGRMRYDAMLLEKALTFNPYNDRALFNLAQVRLTRHRDINASMEAINQFIRINPYHIEGLFRKAERHFQRGELDNAQNTLDIVLNFYPRFKKAKRLQQNIQYKKLIHRRIKGNQ